MPSIFSAHSDMDGPEDTPPATPAQAAQPAQPIQSPPTPNDFQTLVTTLTQLSLAIAQQAASNVRTVDQPKPAPYKGVRGLDARRFLSSCELYFAAKPGHFGAINPKVQFAFGLMQDKAATWTAPYVDSLVSGDRKSTRLNSSHSGESRMPSSA